MISPAERKGEEFLIYAMPYCIGRSSADCSLRDDIVSENHASIERWQGHYYLIDQGSRNGTFVNKQRKSGAKERYRLQHGEMIGITPKFDLHFWIVD